MSERQRPGRGDPQRPLATGLAAIAGLSSLAFAQPLYDLLRRAPEFFAIRDLSMGDLLALTVLLALVPALAFSTPALLAHLVRPAWVRPATAAGTGALFALIAMQALRALPALPAALLAAGAGAGAAWALLRFPAVRSFALLLSAAAIVVPALLLLDPAVRRSAAYSNRTFPIETADTGARAPIVVVVFDEWSLTSILDASGEIDRERLPNLARLADRATWHRNAMAAADVSELAVPSMLTGTAPERGQLPTVAEHPVNLFTLLAPSHDLHAVEPISSLCPPNVNLLARARAPFRARFGLLLTDLAVVWQRLTLPSAWAERLPAVTQTWSGFGRDGERSPTALVTDEPVRRALLHLRNTDRAAEFRRFVDSIRPPGERPSLHFLHSMLPHVPWEYLPSGRRYHTARAGVHGLEREFWADEPWPALHHRKRYLLQVEFVDRLIGELAARLESIGIFDRSLIVVTADHGVAFQPGESRRLVDADASTPEQLLDLAAVPLLVKAPFQNEPLIDDRPMSLIDLTARILELAGADPGRTPTGSGAGETLAIVGKYAGATPLPADGAPWRRARREEQSKLLGAARDPATIGAVPALHGRNVDDFARRPGSLGIRLEAPFVWDHVDLDRTVLPALVEAVFDPGEPPPDRPVAVALNGTIGATVYPHRSADGRSRIAALLPETLFRSGLNRIDAFLISEGSGGPELLGLKRPPHEVYELSWNDAGRVDALLRRSRSALGAGDERLPVVPQNDAGVIGFLDGGYEMRGSLNGWTVDVGRPGSVEEVVAFLGGRPFATASIGFRRPDVAERHGPEHMRSGFVLAETAQTAPDRRSLSDSELREAIRREGVVAYAVSSGGAATRLRFSYRPLEEERGGTEILPITDGRRLAVQGPDSDFGGAVDLVAGQGNRTAIEGWAADLERGERPRQIAIYRDGEFLASLGANRERPDVAMHHEDDRLLRTGFRGTVPGAPAPETFGERHRVFALMLRGAAVELPLATAR